MIDQLKSNDNVDFNALVALYKNSVFNTCYRFLLNIEDAEDISQDVFVAVFQSINDFRGDAKISTWIYRITVTKCLDEIKKRNRKKRLATIGKVLNIDVIANWISGGEMPDSNIQETERWNQIYNVLNKLPENQRVAFTLSKIDGFSNREISEIMDTSTIAVESLIYRAKKKVADEIAEILKK